MPAGGMAAYLEPRVGDLRQIASVRRIQLDDGPERGVRALAFSTGGGLDFWALSDRTLDIGPLWWRGIPLAWQNPLGFAALPQVSADPDAMLRSARMLSGFMMTCGLEHVRQPANGNPLHGRLPVSPVNVTAYGAEWMHPTPHLYTEGTVVQMLPDDGAFRLTRRIEAPVGQAAFSIADTIENAGNQPREMAVLYHINFGFPALASGTAVSLNGQQVFPFEAGNGPDVRCFDATVSGRQSAVVALQTTCAETDDETPPEALTVELEFATASLPWLQVWNDPRPRRNILAIEPVNCARSDDGTSEPAPVLEPGETWRARLGFRLKGS